jgi:pimeloyl-ACP methyl ester carboxylesterase
MRTAHLSGGDVAYVDEGQGSCIVLLHGIGSAARSWAAQIARLSRSWRVVAWNAPGYPPSAPLPMPAPDASDYAHRLADLLDHLHVASCHVAGHSLGCLAAARFARLCPTRIRSLTLASCALGHSRLEAAERERLLSARVRDVDELGAPGMAQKRGPRLLGPNASAQDIASVVETMAMVNPHGYAQAARMLSGGDLIGDLEALAPSLPVQFIYGSADVITPPEVNEQAALARPGAPITILPAAGHACYIEQAEAFSRAVEDFARIHD